MGANVKKFRYTGIEIQKQVPFDFKSIPLPNSSIYTAMNIIKNPISSFIIYVPTLHTNHGNTKTN